MKKITVAVDSFKGSLSSEEVAESVSRGIQKVYPGCDVVRVDIADGGEGTMRALSAAMKGKDVVTTVSGPLLKPVKAKYAISEDRTTAIMEMAVASGLTLVAEDERNPLKTTTKGTGEMILDAINHGCRKVLIGLGGSATNDGGLGMLIALGYKFLTPDGKCIEIGTGEDLERVAGIDDSSVPQAVKETEFVVACDVNNPFCGPQGAAYIFARQKGADDKMIERLDKGLAHFADIISHDKGLYSHGRVLAKKDFQTIPGTGAAGGLGGAFVAFLNAKLKAGIELVLDTIDFDGIITGSDLIITGEGKLDEQTCMGKAPAGVLRRGKAAGIPVIAIGGAIENVKMLNEAGFAAAFSIQPGTIPLEKAMLPEIAIKNVENCVSQIMRVMKLIPR